MVTSSVNDELDSFYNKIQTGETIEKQVSSFFYPKLTDEEIKLVENKDNDVILNTEHDYGRVRAEYECADGINDFFGKLIRVTCTHAEFEKVR